MDILYLLVVKKYSFVTRKYLIGFLWNVEKHFTTSRKENIKLTSWDAVSLEVLYCTCQFKYMNWQGQSKYINWLYMSILNEKRYLW